MTKLNNDDFAKICVAVDRFREHLGRDEAINTINAIIAERWTIAPTDDTELGVFDPDHPAMADEVANMREATNKFLADVDATVARINDLCPILAEPKGATTLDDMLAAEFSADIAWAQENL